MLSVGSGNDVSDDEDMMIVSLLDFNDGEEDEEEDEDDDDDDDNIKKVKECGDDDRGVSHGDNKPVTGNEEGDDIHDKINNGFNNNNNNLNNINNILNDKNDNNNDDKCVNGHENGFYDDDDDDDDMVPSLTYSYSPSIPTIDEEDGEDDNDNNGDDDNDGNNNNNKNNQDNGSIKSMDISSNNDNNNNDDNNNNGNNNNNNSNGNNNNNNNNGNNNNNNSKDKRNKEKPKNQKSVTISHSPSIHHPYSPFSGCHGNRGMSPKDAWKRAFSMIKCMKDPWEKFHILDHPSEFAIRHRFHALRKQWVTDRVEVKMEDKAFDQGAMRSCFRIKKMPTHAGKHRDWKHAHNYVAKQYLAQHVTRDVYFSDVMLQMNAKLWGEEYSRHHPPKKVDIVQMCVLEFTERPSDLGCFYHLEHYIEGDYTKYNSNSGFVEESLRLTPQAFSHFTFERSGHQLIVVDIQGVGDLWTDPQIHSTEDIFGEGNLACKGMALFFHSHQCNPICTSLGLSPFDLASNEVKFIKESKANKKAVCAETIVREHKDSDHCSAMQPSDLLNFLEGARRPSSSESDDDGIVDDVSPPVGYYGGGGGDNGGGDGGYNNNRNNNLNHHYHNNNHPSHNPYHHFNHSHHTRSHYSHHGGSDQEVDTSPLHRPSLRARQRFYSESEDSVSLNKAEEEYRLQFELEHKDKHKPACLQHELHNRNLQAVRRLSDSVLGQVHHELAKYHEMGRFMDGREEGDLVAALFHERCAAELGVKEAMVTMASIYFDLPRELLINVSIERSTETTVKGEEYLLMAASAGDRGAMIYLAKAYETGEGLSTDCKSAKKAVEWYEGVLEMQCEDEVGEFDPLVDTPPYNILATLARLYSEGEGDLERDYAYAGELYSRAGEEATRALKGRLAIKYYALAEEVVVACESD